MSTPWLTPSERRSWLGLLAVVERLPQVLESQLKADADLTLFEYLVLAMLSESPERTLRMTTLASRTNATLPRLSHVIDRLEKRGLIERTRCATDRRATNVRLTDAGWDLVVATAPGHVEHVRSTVFDALTGPQVDQLADITRGILARIDPEHTSPS